MTERAYQVAYEFHEYWLKGCNPKLYEAAFLVKQCTELLKKRDNEYNVLFSQFEESGGLKDISLRQLSQTVFEDKVNCGRMVALFTFGMQIMNKIPSTVLIQWLTYVYCYSERCARDFYVREWMKRHERSMADNEQTRNCI